MHTLPATPGSYILWMKLSRKRRVTIGRLGEHLFRPGFYAYTGSAFGPGGLKARLGHHLESTARPRWHIDYFRNISDCIEIWISTSPEKIEHRFAAHLAGLPGAETPVKKFGSTDCDCPAHFFFFAERQLIKFLQKEFPDRLHLYQLHKNE